MVYYLANDGFFSHAKARLMTETTVGEYQKQVPKVRGQFRYHWAAAHWLLPRLQTVEDLPAKAKLPYLFFRKGIK